jgi:outer membrane protein assembly factor BamB
VDAGQDEVIRSLEREVAARPSGEALARLALALGRAGRADEAFDAGARALALDPGQPCREVLGPGRFAYRSGSVAWKALPVGAPRRLSVVAPYELFPPVDLGCGVVLFVRAGREERIEGAELEEAPDFPVATAAGIELVAIDFIGDRVVWETRVRWMKRLNAAAAPGRLYVVRGSRRGEHEIALLDSRTGVERASRALRLDPRALARMPEDAECYEDPVRWAFALESRHGRPFAVVAGDAVPEALREPPFDLPCLLVPEAVATSRRWVNPPLVAGDGVATSAGGVIAYNEAFERSWRVEGAQVLGALGSDFVLWRRDGGLLQIVDGATGTLLRGRHLGDEVDVYRSSPAVVTRESLVVETDGDAALGLDRKTLETRWESPAKLAAVGSAESVCVLGYRSQPERATEVTILDASTGRETFQSVVPGEPSAATGLFLAGRLFVLTTEGTFCLDG